MIVFLTHSNTLVAQLLQNGTYFIESVTSKQRVVSGISGNHKALMRNGANVNKQKWVFTHIGNNVYKIKNKATNRFLEVPHAVCQNGTQVTTYTSASANHQKWKVVTNGTDIFGLKPAHCLSQGLDRKNGALNTSVHTYKYGKGNGNQKWKIKKVTSSSSGGTTTTHANCNKVFHGEGTFYGYSGGGNCSFPNPNAPVYTGAMNEFQYDGSLTCGTCVEVTGARGSVVVSIEDRCPECKFGDIDLSIPAFNQIDDPIKGRVPISWKIVPCPYNNGVKFRFKGGSSKYWTAVQVRNHRYPVAKLEYKVGGSYVKINRKDYNYFLVETGMGPGPYDFRITDIYGSVIEEKNIPLTLSTDIAGVNQFPTCVSSSASRSIKQLTVTTSHQEVKIYPNPAKDIVNIVGVKRGEEIVIQNLQGKVLLEKIAIMNTERIEISALESGMYLVSVEGGVPTKLMID